MDSWEIPENCIIMLALLGEGQFEEVYKGMMVCVCVCVRACVMSRNEQDEWKMRREEGIQWASIELRCEEPGCMFVGQTKATVQCNSSNSTYTFCGKSFHKQGITIHMNPDGH